MKIAINKSLVNKKASEPSAHALSFPALKRRGLPRILFKRFQRLAARLSPENLCCDGELSAHEVAASAAKINTEWKALEKEAGIGAVSVEEIESEYSRGRRNRYSTP